MLLPCKFYNRERIGLILFELQKKLGFASYVIEGALSFDKTKISVQSKDCVVLVSYIDEKPVTEVYSSRDCDSDASTIDVDISKTRNFMLPLCDMLLSKFNNTSNSFSLSIADDISNLSVCIEAEFLTDKAIQGTLKKDGKDIMVSDTTILREYIKNCNKIESFSQMQTTASFVKTIRVLSSSLSSGEILREIAHYLGKTLVLVSNTEKGMFEQYISTNGALEVNKEPNNIWWRKVAPCNISNVHINTIYLTNKNQNLIIQELCSRKD